MRQWTRPLGLGCSQFRSCVDVNRPIAANAGKVREQAEINDRHGGGNERVGNERLAITRDAGLINGLLGGGELVERRLGSVVPRLGQLVTACVELFLNAAQPRAVESRRLRENEGQELRGRWRLVLGKQRWIGLLQCLPRIPVLEIAQTRSADQAG